MSVETQIEVAKCPECPFFERTIASVVADLLVKTHPGLRSGTCRYNGVGRQFPSGRFQVKDDTIIPEQCPLRGGLVTIRLRK